MNKQQPEIKLNLFSKDAIRIESNEMCWKLPPQLIALLYEKEEEKAGEWQMALMALSLHYPGNFLRANHLYLNVECSFVQPSFCGVHISRSVYIAALEDKESNLLWDTPYNPLFYPLRSDSRCEYLTLHISDPSGTPIDLKTRNVHFFCTLLFRKVS